MKLLAIFTILALSICLIGQTRKTRSDKGGKHEHSAAYNLKHGISQNSSGGAGISAGGVIVVILIIAALAAYIVWYIKSEIKRKKR